MLATIVPFYHGEGFLPPLFDSLVSQSRRPDLIIVVDDASRTESAAALHQFVDGNAWPFEVVVETLGWNQGFAAACNHGLRQALGRGASHLLLANQDLVLESAACEELLKAVAAERLCGLAGAFILNAAGTAVDSVFQSTLPGELLADAVRDEVKPRYRVAFTPATCVLATREALDDVGGFHPAFSLYGEDEEFCSRLKRYGWDAQVVPRAIVHHHHGLGSKPRTFAFEKNWLFSRMLLEVLIPEHASPRVLGRLPLCLRKKWGLRGVCAWLAVLPRLLWNFRALRRSRNAPAPLHVLPERERVIETAQVGSRTTV